MKSFFASILLITYLLSSTGFVVSTHYCMGKVDGLQLGAVKEEKCSKCGMQTEDSDGCCRDEIKVLKLQQDLQPAKALMPSFTMQPAITVVPPFLTIPFLNFNQGADSFDTVPPVTEKKDICVMHCVFRI